MRNLSMGLFGSGKKFECWICHRRTDDDGAFLTPETLQEAFSGALKDFDVDTEFVKAKICICEVCGGIIKLCASDLLAAKMKISSAASGAVDKVRGLAAKIGKKKG